MGFGIPITIRGWDFFLKLDLKDNLGFVGLIGRGGCYYGLVVFGFRVLLWFYYYLLYGWFFLLWAPPGFPLL